MEIVAEAAASGEYRYVLVVYSDGVAYGDSVGDADCDWRSLDDCVVDSFRLDELDGTDDVVGGTGIVVARENVGGGEVSFACFRPGSTSVCVV
jgi:hypothetical protein